MKKIITDKSFYRLLFSIALPIAIQQLIHFGIAMTDSFMLGQLGETQLTASAQANQPKFIFQLILFGLGGGGSVLAAQYWGKRDMEKIRMIIGIVMRLAIAVSLIFTAVVSLFPERVTELYLRNENAHDALIIAESTAYIKIVCIGYIFFGFSVALQNIIRSVEIVKVSIYSSIAALILNIILNRILIFGAFGIPAMGIRGAAAATVFVHFIDFAITAVYIFFIDKKLKLRFRYIFLRDKALSADFTRYGLPVIANEFMWAAGISAQAVILGRLSPDAVAASAIAGVLNNFATIIIFGFAGAAAVVIGKQIGKGEREAVKRSAFTIMVCSVILGVFGMIMMLSVRGWFVSLYAVSAEVGALAERLLVIMAVVLVFASVSAVSIVGVLRGAGDTKFTMKLEFTALWLIAIPLGSIFGFALKSPILTVCAILKTDEPVKAIAAVIRTAKDSTYRNVTR